MKKEYVITIMLLTVLVACTAPPASAWWYNNGLSLSDSPSRSVLNDFSSIDNGSTVENFVVANGSVCIPFEQGLNAEDYTYNFPVPAGVTMLYAGLYPDVWSANYCGRMNFKFNSNNLGTLQFGTDGAGCGSATCDTNNNVAGTPLGGNGVWFDVTSITNAGSTNDFVTDDVTTCPPCGNFDGRKRGCSFIEIYSDAANVDDTLHIWFNQGMETLVGSQRWVNVSIYNVTPSCTNWTLIQCVDCSDSTDYLLFNGNKIEGWNDGSDPDHWMSVDSFDVTGMVNASGTTNCVNYHSAGTYFHPYWVMLIGHNETLDPFGDGDLTVTEIDTLVKGAGGTPYEHVQGVLYTINATVKNIGGADITGTFDVALYNDSVFIASEAVDGLDAADEVTVSFDWTPGKTGDNVLMVVADSDNDITDEMLETNNASSVTVNVFASGGSPDLELSSGDLEFLPTYGYHGGGENNTTIVVNITNTGLFASGAYSLFIDIDLGPVYSNTSMTSLNPRAWMKCEVEYNATPGVTRNVAAKTVCASDSNTGNNATSKNLKTINVMIKVTRDKGKKLFDTGKVVPEDTTLYNAITSVAVVDTGDYEYKAYAIDGLEEDKSTYAYWYAFVNGIPVNDSVERNDLYQLKEGDLAHWDRLVYVNTGESGKFFKPRPIMDYPEPFLHGYGGTVWSTTIVYPSTDASYSTIADNIKTELESHGVTNVNTRTNATLTSTEKQNNHLILLGLPSTNSIIEEVNANHTEVGMTVYFSGTTMIDDDTGASTAFSSGAAGQLGSGANVLEACDNPFNNAVVTDTWMDSSQSIWIVSGPTDGLAKESAEWLISRTCLLGDAYDLSTNSGGYGIAGNGFRQVQYNCRDVNGNGVGGGGADAGLAFSCKYCTGWAVDANGNGVRGGGADAGLVFGCNDDCCGSAAPCPC